MAENERQVPYLAFQALMRADPQTTVEENVVAAADIVETSPSKRAEAVLLLDQSAAHDPRIRRAVELLRWQADKP